MVFKDIQKQVIYTTITQNSTTLCATENTKLSHTIQNLNCSELISSDLGIINSVKCPEGLLLARTDRTVTKSSLLLYFRKQELSNSVGGIDLVTVAVLAHRDVNKQMIFSILAKIMNKYVELCDEHSAAYPGEQLAKTKLGEFKLYMNQIIKFEESHYDQAHNATIPQQDFGSLLHTPGLIIPASYFEANKEVTEVTLLMHDNINKILGRGDKIGSLVEQTDRLQTSSSIFQKNAVALKRRMWYNNVKLLAILCSISLVIFYLFLGYECGFPLFTTCFH